MNFTAWTWDPVSKIYLKIFLFQNYFIIFRNYWSTPLENISSPWSQWFLIVPVKVLSGDMHHHVEFYVHLLMWYKILNIHPFYCNSIDSCSSLDAIFSPLSTFTSEVQSENIICMGKCWIHQWTLHTKFAKGIKRPLKKSFEVEIRFDPLPPAEMENTYLQNTLFCHSSRTFSQIFEKFFVV